jgi:hypothetical protein
VAERLAHAADVGREHRDAAGERLGDDHAVGLGVRGEHEQVGGGVRAVELRADQRPREAHAGRRAAADGSGERRIAVEAAGAGAAPGQLVDGGERVEQHVVPLAGRHRRDAQQRVARRRAHHRLGRVDARLGHVGRHAVELPEPPPAPLARRDHRGRRLQDRALAGVGERHVHQHDLTQPLRVRQQHGGRRRRDQPVQQRDGAVRQL